MKLDDIPTKELLALHNRIADKPAGPKTFATRRKLVARIEQIAEARNIDLASLGQPKTPKATNERTQPQADASDAPEATEEKSHGKGIGALARAILMDPAGHPHALIAEMVNAQIDGAAATAKSVRWYANDMRKRGTEVPPRRKHHLADMDEEQSAEALGTVRVVEPAPSDG
ncbi:hypothetical protein [Xanthomonas citri]|uniref:hypothetical protein n=1 Tax=Xanthomonas citri TaxID=346 RepID=UPI0001CECE39|nr:hypothetical protein [Xanthomonas citri]AMV00289.1 hypothetical protein TP37_21025 [Xanthomonas citri pv. aurantifolii]AMV04605.1 hypothetical protein TP50_20820 [Xanthomonas citri pv. aurantifolii]EFF46492.1 hypothetical protein XAUC_31400 [Xanthomonas citri pv. aurantifolii str. ICPB 10535]MCC8491340.1 hypothetical protein [Xanthomonas citri pv. fuscans]TBW97605.1 hypothetical protein TP47_10660 [Xanthomonas citri pv. aurantifolii]